MKTTPAPESRNFAFGGRECLEAGTILLRTKVQTGGLIQENLLRNLPTMFSTPTAAHFQGILQGVPGFIVAAGPSLDRNKRELLKVGIGKEI